MQAAHTPVLLRECLEYLAPEGDGERLLVDATFGEGGHAEAFLKKFANIRIIGVDSDPEIQARARERLRVFGSRIDFRTSWFDDFFAEYMGRNLRAETAGVPARNPEPDIILFDLGVSMFHYELSGRGFSFRQDEKLDMRLHPSAGITAAELLETCSEKEVAALLYHYGNERYSRRIAAEIKANGKRASKTAIQLAETVSRAVPESYRHRKIHPATKTFQALRIAVNGELRRLESALPDAFSALKLGGKLGVITFHSLEDRIVKHFFRNLAKTCVCSPEQPICICEGMPFAELLTKKPVKAQKGECVGNAPAQSAHLRAVRKLRSISGERQRCIIE
ncbi:16S rRNA (cytosine(1402)-N(4))-methyltransferase RsmH [Treponema endosymbiont of Eucomonympha sp.]|uniref:16S rRNA (cytosine(1402)-N(4))-methyltransferase RsmH n=1 Tax=Treponema endosymbiont of Eucomonympha sp. TaxID=1580831 RepID=UPI0007512DC9|nr:16S rRNA (cytosine(1402)-N(4))-methyltransferase RsmH [Treponema endosymbiont of Eucomonympha sp.]